MNKANLLSSRGAHGGASLWNQCCTWGSMIVYNVPRENLFVNFLNGSKFLHSVLAKMKAVSITGLPQLVLTTTEAFPFFSVPFV